MVFDSKTEPGSLVVLTELLDQNGRSVIAVIQLNRREQNHVVNSVRSVYGKDDAAAIVGWIKGGLLRYWHTQKSLDWFRFRGFQLPREGINQGARTKVVTDTNIVKNGKNQGVLLPAPQSALSVQALRARAKGLETQASVTTEQALFSKTPWRS